MASKIVGYVDRVAIKVRGGKLVLEGRYKGTRVNKSLGMKVTGTPTKAEVKKAEDKALEILIDKTNEIRSQGVVAAKKKIIEVKDFTVLDLKELRREERLRTRGRLCRNFQSNWNAICKHLVHDGVPGGASVVWLEDETIEEWKAARLEEVGAYATMKRNANEFRAALNVAKKLGKVKVVPDFDLDEEDNSRTVHQEAAELEATLRALQKSDEHGWAWPWFMICSLTGARLVEAVRLRGRHFNLREGLVHISGDLVSKKGKTKTISRDVPMHPLIRDWFLANPVVGMQPVLTSKLGVEVPSTTASQQLGKVMQHLRGRKLVPEEMWFRDTRHTFAVLMARETPNLETVKKYMGHTSTAMTERYSNFTATDGKVAIENISVKVHI